MSEPQKQNPQTTAINQMVVEQWHREAFLRAQLIATEEALQREVATRPIVADNVETLVPGSKKEPKPKGVDIPAA